MKIGDRVKVVSVTKSKKSLKAFAFRYGIENIKEIFNYDQVKNETGTITGLGDEDNVFVNLDGWTGDIVFKASELEAIA
jgi:hypothetical protein